jgi:AraC-like DNA-binding protein
MPVAEAGRRLGCADPSHFSRRFRAARGESPGAYRARLHGETDASSAALRKFEDGLRS